MKRAIAFVVVGLVSLGLGLPAASAENADHFLYPPDASPFGKTLPEWLGDYMIWLNEIPTPVNPQVDPLSPENCALQDDPIVFLGSTGAVCSIPSGASLAFSPGYWECSTAEGLGDTFRELRVCARNNFAIDFDPDVYRQRIWIDGQELRHQRRWVVMSPGEIIDFPEDNIWGAVPGPSKSVTKGFMFLLKPLSPGNHRIELLAHHTIFGDFQAVWVLEVDAA